MILRGDQNAERQRTAIAYGVRQRLACDFLELRKRQPRLLQDPRDVLRILFAEALELEFDQIPFVDAENGEFFAVKNDGNYIFYLYFNIL